jgi:hypothetical protein
MASAVSISPVSNQEIAMVSTVPTILQLTVFNILRKGFSEVVSFL